MGQRYTETEKARRSTLSPRGFVILGLIIVGILFFDHGVSLIPPKYVDKTEELSKPFNPIEYMVSVIFGLFFMTFGFCYVLYVLQIFNRVEAVMTVLLVISMPLSEVEGFYVYHWVLFVFFPSVIFLALKRWKSIKLEEAEA